ncbi:MAG: prepilin peptidase [Pseudomonadota bacterium]
MSDLALLTATAGLLPLMAYITYSDMRYLRIPNWSVLAVFGVFIATGVWGMPFETFLWRVAYALIALAVGILVYNLAQGGIGAGDLKLIAALAPFLSQANLVEFMLIYVAVSILGALFFMTMRRRNRRRGAENPWKAFGATIYMPAGVFLGISISIVMVAQTAARFI